MTKGTNWISIFFMPGTTRTGANVTTSKVSVDSTQSNDGLQHPIQPSASSSVDAQETIN
jgi:hypothetical protein